MSSAASPSSCQGSSPVERRRVDTFVRHLFPRAASLSATAGAIVTHSLTRRSRRLQHTHTVLPPKALIGMVHIAPLPGTPFHQSGDRLQEIVDQAVREAQLLQEAGFDAIMLENMHDAPYLLKKVGPEITACMTRVMVAVRQAVDCPLGIQILAGANKEALAVAMATGANFIRVEGFVFSHVADEGIFAEADAAKLLRYRKKIGAEDICIFADIKKKHSSHAITCDLTVGDVAHAAHFFGAEGVIVTGISTGAEAKPEDVEMTRKAIPNDMLVLVGSGCTPENLPNLFDNADAFIVGSYIKEQGEWDHPLSLSRCKDIVRARNRLLLASGHH